MALDEVLRIQNGPNDTRLLASVNSSLSDSPFDELMTTQRTPIITLSSVFPLSSLRNVWSGTVTHTGQEYEVGIGQLESAEYGDYVPGFAAQVGIGMRYTRVPTQEVTWGIFDDSNGLYFRDDDDGLAVGVISNSVETNVPQANWNVDRCDGFGPSGKTLDLSQGVIFQINFTWYGFGQIEYQVVDTRTKEQQNIITVHRTRILSKVSVLNPNLPIVVKNAGAGTVFVAGRQYSILGKYISYQRVTSALNESLTVASTEIPVCSLRRKTGSDFLPTRISTEGYSVVSGDTTLIRAYVGATLTGAVWGTPAGRSASETALEVDSTATAFSGGELIFQELLAAGGAGSNRVGEGSSRFGFQIPRNQPITLTARSLGASQTVRGLLRVAEEW